MKRARVKNARFVAQLCFAEGVLWVSWLDDCQHARAALQRFLRQGKIMEEGVTSLPVGLVVSVARPVGDCTLVRVDFPRGTVADVRVARQGEEVVREEVVSVQFLSEFMRGIDRVFTETDNAGDVRP